MSTVRFFDSIPHIVRYGMHDDKEPKSQTLFYRNGVCFRVHVSGEDVAGTPFEEKWLELIKKKDAHDDEPKGWIRRWESLCDGVITPCLPLLDTLAPSSHKWTTLHDYLHTPTYKLRLVADEQAAHVVPKVAEGPKDRPSYEHNLIKFSEFSSFPEDVPRYPAEDLVVLGQEKNWRRPPHKVRVPGGDMAYFRPCNQPVRQASTGQITNSSVDIINAYLRLHNAESTQSGEEGSQGAAKRINIPRLQGIVVSHALSSPGEITTPPPQEEGLAKSSEEKEPLCAGILLNYVSGAKTLAEVMKMSSNQDHPFSLSSHAEKWRGQIATAVEHLHAHHITKGGRSDDLNPWFFINQHTVYLANVNWDNISFGHTEAAGLEDADAWLVLEGGCTVHPTTEREGETEVEKFKQQQAMDWEAVEKVFQG
ncbi:hypothetical protein Z517_00268 [Fonsecaea pedrosoi CBS 271.37]|uniref:Uncharacterized protein n=1 Tax=Fonsecaea pedrosoi CBS 271.37 TaxID=1442368 RepID=A0A0D2H1W8_9EURO|nr:uncharacterized protein Z517_00268 [Fonsecaea pedrosoi CBS 271.37]KIW84880.1 hypothetical protein Z517_00268 [Fonsecaea pedrosoi CBS 271.37]